jgi:hypothetical protein
MNSLSVAEPSLCSRAMLCSLSISMRSVRKDDPDASQEIAHRHGGKRCQVERRNKPACGRE